jgi:hypothetical protein
MPARHAASSGDDAIWLAARADRDGLHVRVHDPDRTAPVAGETSPLSEGRHGLVIVAALAKDWGVSPDETGKSVWFTLPLASHL